MKQEYFYGHKISDYGLEHGYVDYRTFAQAFEHVLNNDIITKTWDTCGEWEQISGFVDHSEEIKKLQDQIDEIEATYPGYTEETAAECAARDEEIKSLQDQIYELDEERQYWPEIFQYYIISENAVDLLEEAHEPVFYNNMLDMYVWGVTHWGTAWDYVLTNIPIKEW